MANRKAGGADERESGSHLRFPSEVVWKAYQRVKANEGAAGVDGESIAEFERNLEGNLYKLWNRMSSGSLLPAAGSGGGDTKAGGRGVRILGVPTVADRVAQTVVKLYLEPEVEPMFHRDSYGYRPGRSALMRWGSAGSGVGGTTGSSISTSEAFFDTAGPRARHVGGTAVTRT